MKMITLLANTFPIALSLFSSSLPEVVTLTPVLLTTLAMALVLAMVAVLALAWARTHLAHSLKHILVATVNSVSARKQQVNRIPTIGLAPQQNFTLGGTVNRTSQSNAFFNNKYDKN
jgi:hypothetical protein